MKKHIVIAAGLAVLSTSAWATKSRMIALGQDGGLGSHYIMDSRNVFRNAAHVNGMSNYVVTEWGSTAGQNPEGGFFRNAGQFTYGLYLGSNLQDFDSSINSTVSLGGRTTTGTFGAAGSQANSNAADLFFGGDMGLKWGARLHYSASDSKAAGSFEKKHDAMGLSLGVAHGAIEAYAKYDFKNDYEGLAAAGDKIEADGIFNVGASYDWMNYTAFVAYEKNGLEYKPTGAAADTVESTNLEVGVGYQQEVSATSRMIADIKYQAEKAELKTTANGTEEITFNRVPLTVGFETDATSWLTLRGSITQAIIVNNSELKQAAGTSEGSASNTTDVNAGATLNFGKLKVDGMIGTGGNNGTAVATNAEEGSLSLDRLMTQVAVHYWF